MVAPITVEATPGPGGKVTISEGEYTSEGFETDGLDPLRKYPAAIASHFTGPTPAYQTYPTMNYSGSYFEPAYIDTIPESNPYADGINVNPVVNNTAGSIIGYKYFNFDRFKGLTDIELLLDIIPEGTEGTITVYASAPWKGNPMPIGKAILTAEMRQESQTLRIPLLGTDTLQGKHPVYLTFESPVKGKSLCRILYLQFGRDAK